MVLLTCPTLLSFRIRKQEGRKLLRTLNYTLRRLRFAAEFVEQFYHDGTHPVVIYGYARIVQQLDWTDRGGEELEEWAGKEE